MPMAQNPRHKQSNVGRNAPGASSSSAVFFVSLMTQVPFILLPGGTACARRTASGDAREQFPGHPSHPEKCYELLLSNGTVLNMILNVRFKCFLKFRCRWFGTAQIVTVDCLSVPLAVRQSCWFLTARREEAQTSCSSRITGTYHLTLGRHNFS